MSVSKKPEPLGIVFREGPSVAPKATIVLLHGWGSNAREMLEAVSPLVPEEFRLVSIQAPVQAPGGGWMWYQMTAEGPVASTLVTALERLEVTLDPNDQLVPRDAPLFMVGFSQGGTMSLSFATLRFNWVDGVASLSGTLLDDRTLPGPIGVLRGKPVLIIHGRADTVRPVGMSRESVRRLKAAGAIVDFVEHEGAHNVPPAVWDRVTAWVRARTVSIVSGNHR